jgi:hypothetical protein
LIVEMFELDPDGLCRRPRKPRRNRDPTSYDLLPLLLYSFDARGLPTSESSDQKDADLFKSIGRCYMKDPLIFPLGVQQKYVTLSIDKRPAGVPGGRMRIELTLWYAKGTSPRPTTQELLKSTGPSRYGELPVGLMLTFFTVNRRNVICRKYAKTLAASRRASELRTT